MDPMTSRFVSALSLAALLGSGVACTSPAGQSPAPSSLTDPDALLRAALVDYNDRNNIAIAAADGLDASKWKLADTGPALEGDLVRNVFRRHDKDRKAMEPFDMVAVRQLGAPVTSGQGSSLLGMVVAGPRGAATARPTTGAPTTAASPASAPAGTATPGASATPSSGAAVRTLIVLTRADAAAPWLLQMSSRLPDSVGDLGTVRQAYDTERASAVAVVKAVTDYWTNRDVSAGVDLGTIPAERATIGTPSWGQKETSYTCAIDTDPSGEPLVRAAATGQGIIGVGAFHCTYTLTYAKASKVPKLLDKQRELWGSPTGAVLTVPQRGGVTVRVPSDGGRPQVMWWFLDDGMAPALIPAAMG